MLMLTLAKQTATVLVAIVLLAFLAIIERQIKLPPSIPLTFSLNEAPRAPARQRRWAGGRVQVSGA
jgi:hypothetical protein